MNATKFKTIERWAKLLRDVGLILGLPAVIVIGTKLYDREIEALKSHSEALKAQNDVLRETQYDRALALIESQKKLFVLERKSLEEQIHSLEQSGSEKNQERDSLKAQLE